MRLTGGVLLLVFVSGSVGLDQYDERTRKPTTFLSYGTDDGRLRQDEGVWVDRNGRFYKGYNVHANQKFRSHPVPIITGQRSAYAAASRPVRYPSTSKPSLSRQPNISKASLAALVETNGGLEPRIRRKFKKIKTSGRKRGHGWKHS